jgi:RNA polymerase sigma-70 factor (ECF subfamily)
MQEARGDGHFPTTHWTLIARLKSDDEATTRRALDELCAQYHYPLYCYIRRRGLEHHDAQDALHDFLAKLLRHESFHDVDAEKGRLRAFLAAALGRFLLNWKRDRRHRANEVSLDSEAGIPQSEGRYLKERFSDQDTPDRVFERKWASELMRHVLRRLETDYAERGKAALFKVLKPALLRGGSLRGEDAGTLAAGLEMKEGTLRVAYSRLLRDYGGILEAEVRQTVADPGQVTEELRYLRSLFGK